MAALHGWNGLARIWIVPDTGDYYPVKTTLEWLQWRAWGDRTFGYHLTNVCLHAASALLLWRLFRRLGLRWAALGGLLFLVHPIAVESVAWVDELKNTLSLPLLLAAMIFYLEYDERRTGPAAAGASPRRAGYALALLCFLLAMLSKSSVVMFPCVILLHAWWRRGAVRPADLLASAPFFAVSLSLGLVAIWFQRHHGFGGTQVIVFGGLPTRLARAGVIAAFYLGKCCLPAGLMPIYPRWPIGPAAPLAFLPWIAGGLGFAWCWRRRTGWGRPVVFGLGFFLLNVAPVLGFIPISHMRFTWTMDHLVYVPLVGLVGLAAAGVGAADARLAGFPGRRAALLAGAGVGVVALAAASRAYAAIFRDEQVFWSYAVEHNPQAWLADNNLGNLFLDRGDAAAAVGYYQRALRLNPDYPEAEYNFGLACAQLGRLPEAIAHYDASLRLEPNNVGARINLGNALLRLGRPDEAVVQYGAAVALEPGSFLAHVNWGTALLRLEQFDAAAVHFQRAVQADPQSLQAHLGLGAALAQGGRTEEAIAQIAAAVGLAPNDPDLRFEFGLVLLQNGRRAAAAEQFSQVLRLRPDDARAREQLQRLLP
jgi:tetratricopeptide (TPR) repeat protein